jgi:NTP pyrophosphatase (non-canonical NTP hydrolase)
LPDAFKQDIEPRQDVMADATAHHGLLRMGLGERRESRCVAERVRSQERRQALQRQLSELGDVLAGELHAQRVAAQALAMALAARRADHVR